MTRRVQPIETMVAGPASGQASGGRPARPAPPNLAVLKVVSSRAEATLPGGMQSARTKDDAAKEELDDWLKLRKGVAFGVLLAVPFWIALAILAVWLLR